MDAYRVIFFFCKVLRVFLFFLLDIQLDFSSKQIQYVLLLALYDLVNTEWIVHLHNMRYLDTNLYIICSWTTEKHCFLPLTALGSWGRALKSKHSPEKIIENVYKEVYYDLSNICIN